MSGVCVSDRERGRTNIRNNRRCARLNRKRLERVSLDGDGRNEFTQKIHKKNRNLTVPRTHNLSIVSQNEVYWGFRRARCTQHKAKKRFREALNMIKISCKTFNRFLSIVGYNGEKSG